MTSPVAPPSSARLTAWGDGSPRPGLVGALVDAGGVLAGAARLLARHWPALVAIFLAGAVARELIMRAAVKASLVNAELGSLILLLAPMTTLTALVLMLRVTRPSLPWLGSGRGGKPPSVLTHLGSVLVPFMTIYYFEDDLSETFLDYSYRVWEDFAAQLFANIGTDAPDPLGTDERLPYELSLPLAAVVVGAYIGRWLLGRWPAAQRHGWLGLPGAYLELVWLTLVLVIAFKAVSDLIVEWGSSRRLGSALSGLWEQGAGTASGASSPPEAAAGWLLGQLGHVEAVLVIPISWLAIGVVVIGHRTPDLWTSRQAGRTRQAYEKAQRRWSAAPRAIRWLGERLTEDLRGRFTPLVHGVRMLVRAGAVPMLLFCLAFVAVRRLPDWLWQLERVVIGPQDVTGVWVPLAGPLSTLNDAIGTALLICLLAAAVDRALHHSEPVAGPPEQPESAAADPPAPVGEPPPIPSVPGNGQPVHGYGYPHAPIPPPPGPVAPPPGGPPLVPQPTSSRT
jgi:hypothetical protein